MAVCDFHLMALAHHEAGHAVAAAAFGWRIVRVTGHPSDCSGRIVIEPPSAPCWQHDILIALAGPAAQRRFDPEEITAETRHQVYTGMNDILHVSDLLETRFKGGEEERDAEYERWQDRANQFVQNDDVWAAVEAVAALLIT